MSDRFGDERFAGQTQALKTEITSFPAHILHADKINTALQALTDATEDYLIAQVAQFLPDVLDLWETVKRLPESSEPRKTPAEKPIVSLLVQLRALGADEAAIQVAVLRAAALASYRNPSARRTGGSPKDYGRLLRQHLAGFLKKQPSATALVAAVADWQQEVEYPAEQDSFWTRYYRQSVLSTIAVLRKLGSSDAEINAMITEAYQQPPSRK